MAFKNVVIETVGTGLPSDQIFINVWPDGNYYCGYARMKGTYENCVINNMYVLYGDSTFTDCTFNVDTSAYYNVRTYGAVNATFEGCTFNSMGRAIDFCASNGDTVTVTNCVFNDNGTYDPKKAAIEVGDDYNATNCTLIINNIEVNGFSLTAPKGNHGGTSLGTTVWGNKDRMTSTNLNVVIDGVDVY